MGLIQLTESHAKALVVYASTVEKKSAVDNLLKAATKKEFSSRLRGIKKNAENVEDIEKIEDSVFPLFPIDCFLTNLRFDYAHQSAKKKGGKRDGAGRPKSVAKSVTFGTTVESQMILDNLTGIKKAVYINAAISAYSKII